MTDTIKAPWTDEQVAALNAFQASGRFHPFTCGNDSRHGGGMLTATRDGWVCSDCDYRQDWAHAIMEETVESFAEKDQALPERAAYESEAIANYQAVKERLGMLQPVVEAAKKWYCAVQDFGAGRISWPEHQVAQIELHQTVAALRQAERKEPK